MIEKKRLRRFRDEHGKTYDVCCVKSRTRPFELDCDGDIELEELEDGWFHLIQFGTRLKVKEISEEE